MKKKALPFILVSLLIMGMIFFFSSQTGDRSSSLSSHFAMIFYASFDEWHQTWVEARSGQFKDVLLDSSGSILAALLLSKYK